MQYSSVWVSRKHYAKGHYVVRKHPVKSYAESFKGALFMKKNHKRDIYMQNKETNQLSKVYFGTEC